MCIILEKKEKRKNEWRSGILLVPLDIVCIAREWLRYVTLGPHPHPLLYT